MNTLAESGKARRRGLLLITLGGTLLLLVTLIGAALAWHPPRAGFSSGPGFDVLLFGIFAATIGMVAVLGGAAQMRERSVNRVAMYAIPGFGFALIVTIELLAH